MLRIRKDISVTNLFLVVVLFHGMLPFSSLFPFLCRRLLLRGECSGREETSSIVPLHVPSFFFDKGGPKSIDKSMTDGVEDEKKLRVY